MAAVKASSSRSFFSLFDFPETYALDLFELERRYREKTRVWHPDRFSRAPASERAEVFLRATELNEAYRTLRSDEKRAEYLLRLHGRDIGDESRASAVDSSFLASFLELRETFSEAVEKENAAQIASIQAAVETRRRQLSAQLSEGFARLEPGDAEALDRLVKLFFEQRYFLRFADEIALAVETLSSASRVL